MVEDDWKLLAQMKWRPQPPPATCTTLCGTNEEVDYINTMCVEQLPGSLYILKSTDSASAKSLDKVSTKFLKLKTGAPIILTTNISVEHGLVNGRTGIVDVVNDIEGYVQVLLDGNNFNSKINRFKFYDNLGNSRYQYPLKLCWARTVHRAQAMTISGPIHICADNIKQPGQLAVAMSRATSADAISISGNITSPTPRRDVDAFYQRILQVWIALHLLISAFFMEHEIHYKHTNAQFWCS